MCIVFEEFHIRASLMSSSSNLYVAGVYKEKHCVTDLFAEVKL